MGAERTPAIELRALTRRFGARVAVDHVDLLVERGEIFGFLGPNGAGKSTTLRMILGLTRPSSGRVLLFGKDLLEEGAAALGPIGGFVDGPALHDQLTARENLQAFARLTTTPDPSHFDRVLDIVGLRDRQHDRVRTYSYGMRVRLGIAVALLTRPCLLVLDEPTDGLDPNGILDIRYLLADLKAQGVTVFLSSHQLGEVEAVCDRVAIIVGGKLRARGTVAELTRKGSLEELFVRLTTDETRARRERPKAAPPELQPSHGGWRHALSSELFKLRRSRTFLAAFLLSGVLGALGTMHLATPSTASFVEHNGFAALGNAMSLCAPLLMVFVLLLGASSLAAEANDGTLRTILSRPIERGALILGKIGSLAILAAALFLAAFCSATVVALLQDGFSDSLSELEQQDPHMSYAFGSSSLRLSTLVGAIGSYLACLATGSLAIFLSALSRKSAEAIIWSGLVLALLLVVTTFTDLMPERALFFTAFVDGPWQHLTQIAEKRIGADWYWGNNRVLDYTGDFFLDRRRAIFLTLAVPSIQALFFFTLTWVAFVRRDVRA